MIPRPVVDDAAAVAQKFLSSAGEATSRSFGVSNAALQEPACAAFLMAEDVIPAAKASDFHVVADKGDGHTIRPRNGDGLGCVIKVNFRSGRAASADRGGS
jgi:hypothetical protein